jgi:mRNA-degrading endonuclease RelE of RelBE toxin-antitoxin system
MNTVQMRNQLKQYIDQLVKALKGDYSGYYRYRVGDYRVVYSVDDRTRIVNIIRQRE